MIRVADFGARKRRYKVWNGIAPSGYAMKIAKKAGIDPETVMKTLRKRKLR